MLESIERAAQLIEQADALIITAGAGIGVDSGLPDFRGPNGFWHAYPALGRARIAFEEIASPWYFERDPTLAWGFYGHRLQLYRDTVPHVGFALLKRIGERLAEGAFIYTSNVDGQFQRAGFHEGGIVEAHGSIHHLQCLNGCENAIWSARNFKPQVDADAGRLTNAPPLCPHCGDVARPNILMFGDGGWIDARSAQQEWEFLSWRANVNRPVVVELGAGTRIPTVRIFSERQKCPLIRINKTEAQVSRGNDVSIPLGAAAAMQEIAARLAVSGFMA